MRPGRRNRRGEANSRLSRFCKKRPKTTHFLCILCLFVVYNKDKHIIISLRLSVSYTEARCVLCEVQSETLCIMYSNFSIQILAAFQNSESNNRPYSNSSCSHEITEHDLCTVQ